MAPQVKWVKFDILKLTDLQVGSNHLPFTAWKQEEINRHIERKTYFL